MIVLVPVMELCPVNFSKIDRESPAKSHSESIQEWLDYNYACYNDSGLNDVKPITPLSWLFKIENLSDFELTIILEKLISETLEGFESKNQIIENPIEYSPLIPGGYLFEVNNEVKSEPGCCCGLEDILDWKYSDIVTTGHGDDDYVHINRSESRVNISIRNEIFTLSDKHYQSIISDAESKINSLIERNGIIINRILDINTGINFAESMIYKYQ